MISQKFDSVAYSDPSKPSIASVVNENVRDPRLLYLILVVCDAVVALILRDYAGDWFKDAKGFDDCAENQCFGSVAVFRLSFALMLLFVLILLPLCLRGLDPDTKESIFLDNWIPKILILVGLSAATFFMKNKTFVVYATFAQILSFFFILLQIVLLIDFAYSWNERWVSYDEKKWYLAILAISAMLFAASFVIIGYLFEWYTTTATCDLNKLFLSITIIGIIITTAASVVAEHGALLPSAVVALHTTIFCWDALSSSPEDDCPHAQTTGENIQFAIGLAFTFASLTFGVFNVARSHEKFSFKGNQDDSTTNPAIYFMIVLCLAAAYMAMLLSGWEFDSTDDDLRINHNKTSMWIRIVSQWVTFLAYFWTLIAPKCCPDRSFEYN
eukprot:TRINITY_DN1311_c0_g1_i4.p1 TRINITY_DN1311_c0_g1~~TRINITY_DN1311_c0_g1_i4.p1  ORF type:complete len:385 (+),score=90.00 TRINITY_DN1311_c0_g1_i4:52-1206(+)